MCGICGKVAFTPSHWPNYAELDAMCRVMAYRGPDSQSVHLDEAVELGALIITNKEWGYN
jgi:asparagine synthetase B (glutamine-hydrolysing)